MLQVTLPDELEKWVASQAMSNGQSAEDYIVFALNWFKQRDEAEQARIEKLLLEALNSGEPIRVDDKWWDEFVAECMAKSEALEREKFLGARINQLLSSGPPQATDEQWWQDLETEVREHCERRNAADSEVEEAK